MMLETVKPDYTYRRWVVLAAICFINLCAGSVYAWSVFATPMVEHFEQLLGSAPTNLSLAFTLANSVGFTMMIAGGFVNDRFGPRWVIIAGGLWYGAGMFLSGFATSPEMLILVYGLGIGLGQGAVYGATVSTAVKFFPDMPGLAGGVATASYGLSSVVVPVVANGLIASFGVTFAFKALGVAMAAIICLGAIFVATPPKDFAPKGWQRPDPAAGAVSTNDKNWKAMLADPVFYLMLFMLLCGAFSGLMVTSQASPMAQDMVAVDATTAAVVVSVLALFNMAGRIVSGWLSDKFGIVNTLRLVFAGYIVAMGMLLASAGMHALFYAGVCLVGFCFGSFMGIYPSFTAQQFGMRNNSVNYGIMFVGFALAGFFGPTIMSVIRQSVGVYSPAFLVAIVLALLGIGATFVYARKTFSR